MEVSKSNIGLYISVGGVHTLKKLFLPDTFYIFIFTYIYIFLVGAFFIRVSNDILCHDYETPSLFLQKSRGYTTKRTERHSIHQHI